MRVLLINGPNLNLLGHREPEMYGQKSLKSIEEDLEKIAINEDVLLECFQSNHEGEIIDCIHNALGHTDGILINAGAYTHTSIALRDALIATELPYVELHLTNTSAREAFRKKSFLTDKAVGLVSGFGNISYTLAFQGLLSYLRK